MTGTTYERPTTVAEASRVLADTPASLVLSGGTDLAVAMRHGAAQPGTIVDIKRLPDLAPSIRLADGRFRISANTTMTDLEVHADVQLLLPGLVEAAEVVGSVQIRNRASLAGNLCNASPAADTPPVLMALRTTVEVDGVNGPRTIPVDDFFTGYRQTALERGELVTGFELAAPGERGSSSFLKLGVRRAMEISIVCVGTAVEIGDDGKISSAGVSLGSVAPHTVRASAAEEMLIGEPPSDELFAAAGQRAADGTTPIDDIRASAEYRQAMVGVLVQRSLARACERARSSS